MMHSRQFEVVLPVGYRDESGIVHRQAALRKMRGHEEALLYDSALNASQLVTELLVSCLIRLGTIEPVDASVVRQLYTADRNYLLLELRRITLGDWLRASYHCPACGSEGAFNENLSQIEVRWLDEGAVLEDIHVQLADGYEDRDGKLHTDLVLTLPRGTDEEFVTPMVKTDVLKARDALILRCIKTFGTLPKAALEGYGVKILRDLTLGDRRLIHHALSKQAPGVNFQRMVRCEQCGTTFEAVLDISDFFALS